MALFSKQKLFCCICGVEFETTVSSTVTGYFKEAACSRECLNEKRWKEVLSITGAAYYPQAIKEPV